MTRKRNARRRQLQLVRDAIDVAVEGLHHAENELAHALTPPHRCSTECLAVLRLDQGSFIGREPTMMLHLPAITAGLATLVSVAAAPSVAFDTYPKNPGIDALNYAFR